MIDFVLGVYLAALAVRGWLRGMVRELVDLVGMVLGVVVAFRLSGPFGDFVTVRFDVRPEVARLGAGLVLLIVVGASLSVAGASLSKLMRLPGLNLTNRLLGSVLALGWGMVIALAVISLVRVLPFPSGVDKALDDSVVVEAVAGQGAFPRRLFLALAGDEVLTSLTALEPLVGGERLVLDADDRVEIPPASEDDLDDEVRSAELIFELINRERVAAGRNLLVWSNGLSAIARSHAMEMYREGYVSHVSPVTGTVTDRLDLAGIPLVSVGENLALAATARAVHAGLMDSDGHRANVLAADFDRVGIAAVRGPLGLMVVEVFGG